MTLEPHANMSFLKKKHSKSCLTLDSLVPSEQSNSEADGREEYME